MNHCSRWLSALSLCSGMTLLASPIPAESIPTPATPKIEQKGEIQPDFFQHFQTLGVEGSVIIYDLNQDHTYQHNAQRNTSAFLPASTFKIINSLIALETGAIASDLSVLTWDGIERSISVWNRDHNMRTAFQVSAVWFYQVLARRIGHGQMQQYVIASGYGNQSIGSVEDLDTFWLSGDIQITPEEQIQFLQRLYSNDLPFSEETITTVKDIMLVEKTPNYTIRAKTGWAVAEGPRQAGLGWYVGYVEQNENVYFFATNLDIRDENDLAARLEVTRLSLETLQLL